MRILLVSDHYPPFIGGAHRQTRLLARELTARGHDVSVATAWHRGLPPHEVDTGVTVYRLRQLRTWLPGRVRDQQQRHQPPFPDPVTIWALRRLIDRLQPDVVHAYGWFSYSAAAAMLGRRTPLLISARDYGYGCARRTLLYRDQMCAGPKLVKCLGCASRLYGIPKGWAAAFGVWLSRPLLRHKARGLHSISTYVRDMVRRDFLDDRAAPGRQSLPHAVIPSFREDDAAPGTDAVKRYVQQLPPQGFMLFVGALRLVKGLRPLLAAYQRLQAPPPLVLIGTVEHDTPTDFPPGVTVLQAFPHEAVMAAWERCLFGVLPSLWAEPLGSVVYEGMSRGKAIIGTVPGGHSDMIRDGETGFLVPAGDVAALAAAMQRLIDDGELRERLGRAARELSNRFLARQAVPQFERLYAALVERAAHSSANSHVAPLGR